MTYKRFEDLPVWQQAAALYELTEKFIAQSSAQMRPSFRDQLERAVLSISNNIAEGFERGTTNEILAFLYIARGSAGEVRSMLWLLDRRLQGDPTLHRAIEDLIARAESCSRQLRAWADSLQNSTITGTRHLNEQTRASYNRREAQKAGLAAFQQSLRDCLPVGHPARPAG